MQRTVKMTRQAQKQFAKLQRPAQKKVAEVVDQLADGIPANTIKLQGIHAGYWRTRAGYRHRVIWYVETAEDGTETAVVTWVGDREDVPY